ncbi:MAG: exodeoxyribonuclease VII large subunit, partial [Chloroflexota bacterium]|nr:exodeoxyribonuclease VII large subunit [Chloroflexota bacterium]
PDLTAARQRAAELVDRGERALGARLERRRLTVDAGRDALRALGPAATLERGYAVARLADGRIVRSPDEAPVGSALEVVVARGRHDTRVEGTGADRAEDLLG